MPDLTDKLRIAALTDMDRFADRHDVPDRNWCEIDQGDAIQFVGRTRDGREFACGYIKPPAI